mmetsp:Transcript_2471/g.5360  ORF Transcript_2471/g.5360 Transcript_2471/m.5360 type:complete len:311 (+) Transcript_2471:1704-2636(+)
MAIGFPGSILSPFLPDQTQAILPEALALISPLLPLLVMKWPTVSPSSTSSPFLVSSPLELSMSSTKNAASPEVFFSPAGRLSGVSLTTEQPGPLHTSEPMISSGLGPNGRAGALGFMMKRDIPGGMISPFLPAQSQTISPADLDLIPSSSASRLTVDDVSLRSIAELRKRLPVSMWKWPKVAPSSTLSPDLVSSPSELSMSSKTNCTLPDEFVSPSGRSSFVRLTTTQPPLHASEFKTSAALGPAFSVVVVVVVGLLVVSVVDRKPAVVEVDCTLCMVVVPAVFVVASVVVVVTRIPFRQPAISSSLCSR